MCIRDSFNTIRFSGSDYFIPEASSPTEAGLPIPTSATTVPVAPQSAPPPASKASSHRSGYPARHKSVLLQPASGRVAHTDPETSGDTYTCFKKSPSAAIWNRLRGGNYEIWYRNIKKWEESDFPRGGFLKMPRVLYTGHNNVLQMLKFVPNGGGKSSIFELQF